MDKVIKLKNVSKEYKLYKSAKERMLGLFSHKIGESFYALKDVSFEAEEGDIIGFVGINGSGKSTLSNIIAGIVPESGGDIEINGEASLIAVASGLKGDLTGRENIELKLLMLGFDKEAIAELEPSIIEFSELNGFIDQPVKSYSSGMKSRLGFAISVNIDPDILIIDEALSVGDKAFATKSLNKMHEFKEKGKTMIFVSHSLGQMKQFCEKILWLEFGKVKQYGDVDDVIHQYELFLKQWEKMSKEDRRIYQETIESGKNIDVVSHASFVDSEYKNEYIEPVSLLGHIKGGSTQLFKSLNFKSDIESLESFKHSSYYIKRKLNRDNEQFLLLSNEPSGEKGVVGWVKAGDMETRSYTYIDSDKKSLWLSGDGAAYNRPWGGKKNIVYNSLQKHTQQIFNVEHTFKVGSNIWYNGVLNEQSVWIHENFLEAREGEKK